MNSCAFCGRANDTASRYCIDCGKPMSASAARVTPAVGPLTPPQPVAAGALAGVGGGAGTGMMGGVPRHGGAGTAAGSAVASSPVTTATLAAHAMPAFASCPHCGAVVEGSQPFCSQCGRRTGFGASAGPACPACGAGVRADVDLYCGRCGRDVRAAAAAPGDAPGASATHAGARDTLPRIALLDDGGEPARVYAIERGELIVGRADGDIRFPDDVYLSPIHALFAVRDGGVWLRDLGSRNGSWVFGEKPFRLADGDVILVGSQLLRFRRLGYPGPHPPEADATRRLGSLVPSADVAVLQQLRADGSVRDTLHLSPGRNVVLGRESGDWVFPYDQTMSGRHAEVRSEDSEFVVHDLGSRNGVALATRGERKLDRGTRVLVGDQILRVESI